MAAPPSTSQAEVTRKRKSRAPLTTASPYLWSEKSASATGQRFYRAVADWSTAT